MMLLSSAAMQGLDVSVPISNNSNNSVRACPGSLLFPQDRDFFAEHALAHVLL
jgi:hypothetical protein